MTKKDQQKSEQVVSTANICQFFCCMNKHLKIIEREIEAQRDALKQHRVYDLLNDVDDIRRKP